MPSKRFLGLFAVSLVAVAFLPLYITRTMTRSFMVGDGGDVIDYGWGVSTLPGYAEHMRFSVSEQQPMLWLVVNLALAAGYAGLLAYAAHRVLNRSRARETGEDGVVAR